MILKALTLENFKGIREPVRIEFAPLTLLFGPNNAGKSTIVQALMYAREVLERNNCDAGRTVLGGDVVDLGGFRSLVHAQDTSRAIRMRFEVSLDSSGLRNFTSSDRQAELKRKEANLRRGKFRNMRDAIGLDPTLLQWAREKINTVWVEFEVAQRKSHSPSSSVKPTVTSYSVGVGSDSYATVSLGHDTGRAALSYFNFGLPPFGFSYRQGELTNSDWDMERIFRCQCYRSLEQVGLDVAFAGESAGRDVKRISREDFDTWVSSFLTQGLEQTGKGEISMDDKELMDHPESPLPTFAELLNDVAEKRGRLEEKECQVVADNKDIVRGIVVSGGLKALEGKKTNKEVHLEIRSLPETHILDTAQWQGWLLTWFSKLTPFFKALARKEPNIDRWSFEDPLLLASRGTAMPDWEIGFEPYSLIWASDAEDVGINSWLLLAREYLIDFLNSVIVTPGALILQALESAKYLSPFRKLPGRDYRPSSGSDAAPWAAGLAAWNLLATGSESALRAAVSEWLTCPGRFGTQYRVIAQRRKTLDVDSDLWISLVSGRIWPGSDELKETLENLPEESKLKLEHIDGGLLLAPQDLGVGISQLIPVIVAALHKPDDQGSKVIMIEEPESNIHPAFQVVLADLFITQAKANPGVMFLVETHSEHLMLRCLRRIRETSKGIQTEGIPSVTPEDVAVHFVEPTENGPRIHRIEIDEEGDFIDEWPGGFFEQSFHEKFAGR